MWHTVPKNREIGSRCWTKKGFRFSCFGIASANYFALAFSLLWPSYVVLSNFLWTITIDGNTTLTKLEVLERLESFGVREGMWKWSLNCYQVKEKMLTKYLRPGLALADHPGKHIGGAAVGSG
ncbi:MAG: sporulation protein YqfD [Clostridia bacterium]